MKFIPWAKPNLNRLDKKFLLKSFDSNWISSGNFVDKLENSFAKFLKSKKTLTVNNGTSAIHIIYLALNLKRGDEIITPPNSFIASTSVIAHLGAKPVFVDVLPDQNIDPNKIIKAITKKIVPAILHSQLLI